MNLFEHLDDETKLKKLVLHMTVAYTTSVEAMRRGEIDDFEIVVQSDGTISAKVVRK